MSDASRDTPQSVSEPGRHSSAVAASLLEFVLQSANDSIFVKDCDGRYIYVNPAMERLFQCPASELLGNGPDQVFPPEQAANIRLDDERVLRGESLVTLQVLTINGVTRTFEDVKTPLKSKNGEIIGICAIARDITARRKVETELVLSQRENQALLAAIPDMILRVTRSGQYISCKYPRDFEPWKIEREDEIVGQYISNSIPPEISCQAMQAVTHAIDTGDTQQFQYSVQVGSETKHREARVVSLRDSTALIILRDITIRKQSEEKLHAYHQLLDSIRRVQNTFIEAPSSNDVFTLLLREMLALAQCEFGFICQVLAKPDGGTFLRTLSVSDIAWNEETRKLYDEKGGEGLEFHNMEMLVGAVVESGEVVISNDPKTDPRSGGLPEGHPPLTSFLGIPLRYEGAIIGVAGMANRQGGFAAELVDFLQPFINSCGTIVAAHRNRLRQDEADARLQTQQAQLAHVSRLTTMGEMVAEIAHELSQPLSAITNFVEASQTTLLGEIAQDDPRILEWLRRIKQQTDRGANILERLREYGRRAEPRRDECDLSEIAEDAVQLMRVDARRHLATVQLEGAKRGLRVMADRVQIQQVLVNLILNAFEAMDGVAGSRRQAMVLVRPRGNAVEVAVEDDGCGLPVGQAENVFGPFFTTKVGGMGLGLSICRSIIEAHRGRLWVTPNATCGVTFRFSLPLLP